MNDSGSDNSNNQQEEVDASQNENNSQPPLEADQSAAKLQSLSYYESLRTQYNSDVIRAKGSLLDVLNISAQQQQQQQQGDQERIAFCNLVGLVPLQPDGGPNEFAYEASLAIALAAEHLNTGDGSLIENVEGLNNRCDIRFITSFIDTHFNAGRALEKVIDVTSLEKDEQGERYPSVFLGAFRSDVSVATSIVTGLQGYPQISGASTSVVLDDKTQFPLFARTIPSDDAVATSTVKFFRQKLDTQHVAVININDVSVAYRCWIFDLLM
jgi:Receptor family ligand binding region